jgi:hypothetical protein
MIEAAMTFYTDIIEKDHRFDSVNVINDLALLEPGTRAAVEAMIADAALAGHELRVLETYRSQARQHMLWTQHLTQLSKVGCHGFGVAADLALYVNGRYDPNGQHYMFMEALAKKHGLVSGIDWGAPNAVHSFHDYDHVQRVPVFRQNAMFAETWYPPSAYDPYADQVAHGVKGT